jgi:acetyl-CoA carboxylase biotin carboxyl carrier protein
MDFDQLKRLLDLVREHDLSEFEIEHEGLRLKIRKDGTRTGASGSLHTGSAVSDSVAGSVTSGEVASVPASGGGGPAPNAVEEVELAVVKSPIVGTFYRAPEPEAPPFVEIGSSVKKGQVLCIIEAMKLMNEIDSEYDGEIVNVYVENGQPVQYGERLFAIRTT